MSELTQLFATLKRLLKAQGLTYRDLAGPLELSEASVKRLFASGNFSLERLATLCELLGITLAELTAQAAAEQPRVRQLTQAQEQELVSDPKLLIVAACALNHWSAADIVAHYRIEPLECLQRLLRLDQLRLIDLLPGDRIRLNLARDFDWLPDGPIRRYFREHGEADFLASSFTADDEAHVFVHGMLSAEARAAFLAQIRQLRQRFAAGHEDSRTAPIGQRRGIGVLLAMREWEPPDFAGLKRTPDPETRHP